VPSCSTDRVVECGLVDESAMPQPDGRKHVFIHSRRGTFRRCVGYGSPNGGLLARVRIAKLRGAMNRSCVRMCYAPFGCFDFA
jgi:hypothetical protein